MDEETKTKILKSAEAIYNAGKKDGKGEGKAESKSENHRAASKIASQAAKKVEDKKSTIDIAKFAGLINNTIGIGKPEPDRAKMETIARAAIEISIKMPAPPSKAKPKKIAPTTA